MGLFIVLALVVAAFSGLVWWVNRPNSGSSSNETGAENFSAETRKDWGPG